MKRILHVGCGGDPLPPWLFGEETRLDIDDRYSPDIVADMTDMGDIGTFDIVYCSHAVEHLYWHDVKKALGEFRRVLSDGGQVVVIVPDLEDVRPTEEVLYTGFSGPVSGLDMYFGFRPVLEEMPFMAHRSGFVTSTLESAMRDAGYSEVITRRVPEFNLLGVATK